MKLADWPVPSPNTKFGVHLLPRPCQDIANMGFEWHRARLAEIKAWGASWASIITSPGGADYTPGLGACSELTFDLAVNEFDLGVMLRIWSSGVPPYITPEIEVMLRRMMRIAKGKPIYVKFNNEIDAEWKTATGRYMTETDARYCCRAIAAAIDKTWQIGDGQLYPSFLNVGYGGSGFEFFRLMHEEGVGDRLDRCWVPVHPYNGAWLPDWPWSQTLNAPLLMTPEGYAAHGRWAWQLDNIGARQTLEFVNAARLRDHAWRQELKTTDDLINAYAYGMFTYEWPIYQLNELGHTETPLMFPEFGTRTGEQVEGLPCVGPLTHKWLSLEMIARVQSEERALALGYWHHNGWDAMSTNWVDQGLKGPVWSFEVNQNMPADWRNEIETSGQLPLVDHLLRHPIGGWPVSKLWFHIQDPSAPGLEAALTAAKPGGVKVMGDALNAGLIARIRQLIPGVFIIGRYHRDPSNQPYEDDPLRRAAELVRDIVATGCVNLVDAWESYNEVAISHMTAAQVEAYDSFMVEFHRLIQALGVRYTLIINSPVGNLGWPGEVSPCAFRRALALPDTLVSFHGYEWHEPPASDRAAYLFRPFVLAEQVTNEYPNKEFVFSEMGVTHAAVPGYGGDTGWRSNPNPYTRDEYLAVLRAIDRKAKLYPRVKGCCIFQTGCANDWRVRGFESIEEVRQVILEVPFPESPGPPPDEEEPEVPPLPAVENDAQNYGVRIVEAAVQPGQAFYRIVRVHHLTPEENNGNHHLYADVLDRDGQRVNGAIVGVTWPNGAAGAVVDKPANEPGTNVPLYHGQVVEAWVVAALASDRIKNVHTFWPDEPPVTGWGHNGNSQDHHSFFVVWQECVMPSAEEPEPPPDEPPSDTPPTEEEIRNELWNRPIETGVIAYNPDAAFALFARWEQMGAPLTNEWDCRGWRLQKYALACVACPIGEWDKIKRVDY